MLVGDRVSRQQSLLATCIAIAVLGLLYPTLSDSTEITIIGFALVTSIYTLVTLGLYAYVPELFPAEYRLRGTGVAGVCGRAAAITTPYLTIYLFDNFGVRGVLWMVIVMLAALSTAILTQRVETAKISLDDNGALAGSDAGLSSAITRDQGI
jgi:MFS transporter, putative metabolite:H+ symporter